MQQSTRWSGTSAPCGPDPCRIAWRPSRWAIGALILLAALAPFAVLQSEMPRPAAWPLAALAAAWGLHSAWREACKPARAFAFHPDTGTASLDGRPLALAEVQWRGPLAFLRWRDAAGQGGRLAWWPDTLPAAQRRELRLAAGMAP
jgi:toxin CptA